jgi:hypothetical protein
VSSPTLAAHAEHMRVAHRGDPFANATHFDAAMKAFDEVDPDFARLAGAVPSAGSWGRDPKIPYDFGGEDDGDAFPFGDDEDDMLRALDAYFPARAAGQASEGGPRAVARKPAPSRRRPRSRRVKRRAP